MSGNESAVRYAQTHEWVEVDGSIARVGITTHAVEELQDLVFVDLPDEGDEFQTGEVFGSIESVKAVSDLHVPVSGRVTHVNRELEDTPELVSDDPHGDGWMIEITLTDDDISLDHLMTKDAYDAMVAEED